MDNVRHFLTEQLGLLLGADEERGEVRSKQANESETGGQAE